MTTLGGWANFYVITGSAAGALLGLQFVVLSLIAQKQQGTAAGIAAFATPTIAHFEAVLFLSAIANVPWQHAAIVAAVWGATGLGGMAYIGLVARRLRAGTGYEPVAEDWLYHAAFPAGAYAILIASALLVPSQPLYALFGVGGWMFLTERYELSLAVLMVYVGLLDGFLKLKTGSSSVTSRSAIPIVHASWNAP